MNNTAAIRTVRIFENQIAAGSIPAPLKVNIGRIIGMMKTITVAPDVWYASYTRVTLPLIKIIIEFMARIMSGPAVRSKNSPAISGSSMGA
jgi:hypothetical protein